MRAIRLGTPTNFYIKNKLQRAWLLMEVLYELKMRIQFRRYARGQYLGPDLRGATDERVRALLRRLEGQVCRGTIAAIQTSLPMPIPPDMKKRTILLSDEVFRVRQRIYVAFVSRGSRRRPDLTAIELDDALDLVDEIEDTLKHVQPRIVDAARKYLKENRQVERRTPTRQHSRRR